VKSEELWYFPSENEFEFVGEADTESFHCSLFTLHLLISLREIRSWRFRAVGNSALNFRETRRQGDAVSFILRAAANEV
jgi:hypothetical protein